jgi:hypothetical protein
MSEKKPPTDEKPEPIDLSGAGKREAGLKRKQEHRYSHDHRRPFADVDEWLKSDEW